ncbi:MAG: hypothetical protein LBT03_01745 [Holosporales bacterium]|nr:hypothetical protein [Holosporales bacterium]
MSGKLDAIRKMDLCPSVLNLYVSKYSFGYLLNDIFAGVKIFLLLAPVALALAFFCGISPIQGTISCAIAALIGSVMGGSKYQISSIALPICVLTFEIMSKYQYKGLLYTSIFAGGMLVLYGTMRMSEVLKHISHSFISALSVYVVLSIMVNQLQYIFGISVIQSSQGLTENFMLMIGSIENITSQGAITTAIFIVPLIVLRVFFSGFFPFFAYIALGGIAAYLSDLGLLPGIIELKTVGKELLTSHVIDNVFTISKTVPSQIFLAGTLNYAFAISLIIGTETCFTTNIAACITGDKKIQHNVELIATGISNFISIACGGIFVSPNKTLSLKNIAFKSQTIISILIVAILSYALILFGDIILRYTPIFCLSSILIVYAASEIIGKKITQYLGVKSNESYIFLLTFGMALYFGFIPATIVGFTISSILFAKRMMKIKDATVHTTRNHDSGAVEFMSNKNGFSNSMKIPRNVLNKIEVIQVTNVLFLNIAKVIEEELSNRGKFPSIIIIYFKNIPYIDEEGFLMLKQMVAKVTQKGAIVIISGTNGVLLDILQQKAERDNEGDVYGYIVPNFREAIEQSVKRMS